jgi:hypothetical protein
MPRSAASIQSEINTLETFLGSSESTIQSTAADGTSINYTSRTDAAKRLDQLYTQLGRANGTSPMFARGVVTRLRGR